MELGLRGLDIIFNLFYVCMYVRMYVFLGLIKLPKAKGLERRVQSWVVTMSCVCLGQRNRTEGGGGKAGT